MTPQVSRSLSSWLHPDHGRVWAAVHVGALVYVDGSRFVTMCTGSWKGRLGEDLIRLTAAEAKKLKGTDPVPSSNRGFVALTEAGVLHSLSLTNTREGMSIMHWFTREVAPQINRDGSYLPGREVVNDQIIDNRPPEPPKVEKKTTTRELRLAAKEAARLARQPGLDPVTRKALTRAAAEAHLELLGLPRPNRPPPSGQASAGAQPWAAPRPASRGWWTTTQIARELGVTVPKVTDAIDALGLKVHGPLANRGQDLRNNNRSKPEDAWSFHTDAANVIAEWLRREGHIEVVPTHALLGPDSQGELALVMLGAPPEAG